MKVRNVLVLIAVVVMVGFATSCEKNDTAETETLYGVDKGIQRPGPK